MESQTITDKKLFFYLKILALPFLVWVSQILFLNQAARWGMNGGDDWQLLFYYDAARGYNPANFFSISNYLGTPYLWTQLYYIGVLKSIFGINQFIFKEIEILLKVFAAFSSALLVFKLTKNKIFALLTIYFFIVFPSTAGVLSHVGLMGGYLSVIFGCIFIALYIHNPKKIYLISLFFFLALLACPPRAYLLLPIPFIVELIRLRRHFQTMIFLKRLIIFYLPLILLIGKNNAAWFEPHKEFLMRIKQVTDGNLYTISLPFQAISTLFIDQTIVMEILGIGKRFLPFMNPTISGFLFINFILFLITFSLGLVIKRRKGVYFVIKITGISLFLQTLFYLFGVMSLQENVIIFNDSRGNQYWYQSFYPSIYQACLGGYIVALGIILIVEWWKNQKDNKILMVTCAAWVWLVFSEIFLYLTNKRWEMILESNDRYILLCSVGAVIFTAGIFTLIINSIKRLNNLNYKLSFLLLTCLVILVISYKDYKYIDSFYYKWNEGEGGSSYWQNVMYQRFVDKLGPNNLKKSLFLYIDHIGGTHFEEGSFVNPLRVGRMYYDEKGTFVRGTCKFFTDDFNIIKAAYTTKDGEKGFAYNTTCVNSDIGQREEIVFYSLDNFHAYRIQNKQFIDIKNEIVSQLVKKKPP